MGEEPNTVVVDFLIIQAPLAEIDVPAAPAAPVRPVVPPPPVPHAVPAFSLGPGQSNDIVNYDDPTTDSAAIRLFNKTITPLELKFDDEADNLAGVLPPFMTTVTIFQLDTTHHCAH